MNLLVLFNRERTQYESVLDKLKIAQDEKHKYFIKMFLGIGFWAKILRFLSHNTWATKKNKRIEWEMHQKNEKVKELQKQLSCVQGVSY